MRVTEPTTAASVVAAKTIGLATLAGIIAGAVAMSLTPPKSVKEFACRLTVTVLTSVMAAPLVIDILKGLVFYYFHTELVLSFRSEIAIAFLAGVPSWLIWSWLINRLEKNQNKTVLQLVNDAKKIKKAIKE